MNKPLFTGLIYHKDCMYKMKPKKEKGKIKYVCGLYDRKGECSRCSISEEFILELISNRFERELTREEIQHVVEKIVIEDKHLLEINFKSDESIILGRNFLQL